MEIGTEIKTGLYRHIIPHQLDIVLFMTRERGLSLDIVFPLLAS